MNSPLVFNLSTIPEDDVVVTTAVVAMRMNSEHAHLDSKFLSSRKKNQSRVLVGNCRNRDSFFKKRTPSNKELGKNVGKERMFEAQWPKQGVLRLFLAHSVDPSYLFLCSYAHVFLVHDSFLLGSPWWW